VTRKKLLVGTIDMEAIAEEKRGRQSPLGASEKSAPRSITIWSAPQS
jgi:hypothetical protein